METNRQKGWKHAKISGHQNEVNICKELGSNYETQTTKVESIFGEKTPSKTDLYGTHKFSVKKSLSGQVQMNKVFRWILGYEIIYGEIPYSVKKVFYLLFGGFELIDEILKSNECVHPDPKIRKTEEIRKTLTIDTLEKYDNESLNQFITWLEDNISNVVEIVFSKGWSKYSEDWAEILWYKNSLGENNVNQQFLIKEIALKCKGKKCFKGTKNGGTTIQLPFGHLQYHQGGLQFHHSFEKISKLFID